MGKLQLLPKENLVEFVTLDIFKLYMPNKADRLIQNVPNSYLNVLYPNRAKWHDVCRKGINTFYDMIVLMQNSSPKQGFCLKFDPLNGFESEEFEFIFTKPSPFS